MLLSPQRAGECVDADVSTVWRPAAAGHRVAHGVLTLPDVSADVPPVAGLSHQTQQSVTELVLTQFRAGPLSARDVTAPSSPGNAYAQALFKWFGRQHRPFRFLSLEFGLYDADAVRGEIQHQYEADQFDGAAPLYLSVSSDGEGIYSVKGRAARLGRHHPQLLPIALSLIRRAARLTAWLRLPDELLSHFAHWYWDGDENGADEDVAESIADRFGEDGEEAKAYLPSVVRPEICPDTLGLHGKARDERKDREILRVLLAKPGTQRLARQLLDLEALIRKARGRPLLDLTYHAQPVYTACALVWEHNDRTADLFDDLYQYEWEGGEASLHHGFISIAQEPRAIRRQFAQWQLAFQVLSGVDRVLGCITD